MSRDVCREIFVRGCDSCDLGMVEGRFDLPGPAGAGSGSQFDRVCDWLDLPRLVVLDASLVQDCRLPERPGQVDGLLLDRVTSPGELFRLQTWLEALWDVPVLGALGALPEQRSQMAALPTATAPPRELCRELGQEAGRYLRRDRLLTLAARRDFPDVPKLLFKPPAEPLHAIDYPEAERLPLTVAVAFDAAFNCYFSDALELLEVLGARVVDFSPLRDEVLPEADIVYFGCGHPERYAATLTSNHCMLLALRNHVCAGRRVYAEGGGLAYLCQYLATADGRNVPMAGLLPALARQAARPAPVEPREVTLAKRNWLGDAGTRLRGYLNSSWQIEPLGRLTSYLAGAGQQYDLVGRYQVLGSRLHLNFAAQSHVLRNFFEPCREAATLAYTSNGGWPT